MPDRYARGKGQAGYRVRSKPPTHPYDPEKHAADLGLEPLADKLEPDPKPPRRFPSEAARRAGAAWKLRIARLGRKARLSSEADPDVPNMTPRESLRWASFLIAWLIGAVVLILFALAYWLSQGLF